MDRGSQLDEEDEDDENDKDDEEDEEEEDEEAGGRRQAAGGRRQAAGGRRQATDIKSNNPHLAGGEQPSPGRWGTHSAELRILRLVNSDHIWLN